MDVRAAATQTAAIHKTAHIGLAAKVVPVAAEAVREMAEAMEAIMEEAITEEAITDGKLGGGDA